MQLLNFNIIRLFIFQVSGILIGHHFKFDLLTVLITSFFLILGSSLTWFVLRKNYNKHYSYDVLVYLTMIMTGTASYLLQCDINRPNHYTKECDLNGTHNITLRITKRLKPNAYNEKYFANIIAIDSLNVNGQFLINIKKDSLSKLLDIDAVIATSAQIKSIQGPLNPHQFDYKAYLEIQNIYHQINIDPEDLKILSTKTTTLYGWADILRRTINKRLKVAGFKEDSMAIINAMLLGQRQDIDRDIYNNYINSGTIHILAVSGLHVGIILVILNSLFKPLLFLKHGRILRPVLIVILLWLFAIIAGLSPSVTRAVTMFSIISIAMHLKRPTNIYNTLIISAFIILLVKPNFLFQVGFQMSYVAVFGIVSIQPILYNIFKPKFVLIDKLWEVFTVTVAAQIAVVPISLLYFHQFPGLFFISNVVIVPLLGLILGLGLLVIVLGMCSILPKFLVTCYSAIIEKLNAFIACIATFEDFLFRDIPFDIVQVLFCYVLIISLIQLNRFKKEIWIIITLVAILGLQVYAIFNKSHVEGNTLIVFNKSRHTIIGLQKNKMLYLYSDLDSTELKQENLIKNYKVGERIKKINWFPLNSVFEIKQNRLLVVDSLGTYKPISFSPDYILLRSSPKINLTRLIDSLKPKIIIADASNYSSYVRHWKKTCIKRSIAFYYTKANGALILN